MGTLLLAMGVGVLIGRNSASNVNTRPVQAAAPTVVTVGGGAGTGADGRQRDQQVGQARHRSPRAPRASQRPTTPPQPTAAQAAKASNAASKVLGSSNKALPPATVTVGQTGHGPGYNKTGKFDGSFFGQ